MLVRVRAILVRVISKSNPTACKINGEGAFNCDDTNSSQVKLIKPSIGSVWQEVLKMEHNRGPLLAGLEALTTSLCDPSSRFHRYKRYETKDQDHCDAREYASGWLYPG
jgi:hypothetical protein